ncbi:hypothetical protein LTR15_006338 [Elasticomyces elasticus]|nr:hypothetical protein LTR15_006338 [Elasticomyces elasticus]
MATIQAAFDKFEEKFKKACTIPNDPWTSTLNFYQRTDLLSQTLLKFLEDELELAPCYKLKTYLALSRVERQHDSVESMSACRQYLWKAGMVLKDCWVVYKGVEDLAYLDNAEQAIKREWGEFGRRRWWNG